MRGLSFLFLMLALVDMSWGQMRIDSLKKELATTESPGQQVKLLNYIAWDYLNVAPDTGLIYAKKALKIGENNGYHEDVNNSLETIGTLYGVTGNLDESIATYHKALNHAKTYELTSSVTDILEQMINTYIDYGMYDIALTYFDTVGYYVKDMPSASARQRYYFNYAVLLKKTGELEKAQLLYRQAAKVNPTDQSAMALLYANLANVKQSMAELDSALYFYQKSLSMLESSNYQMYARIYNGLSDIYLKQSNVEIARDHNEKALFYANKAMTSKSRLYALHNRYQISKMEGDFRSALENLTAYHHFKDSLEEIANKEYALELQRKYDNEKQARQIENLRNKNELSKRDNDLLKSQNDLAEVRFNRLVWIGILCFIALVIVIYSLRLRYSKNIEIRKEQAKRKDIEITKKQKEIEGYKRDLRIYTENLLRKNTLITEMEEELQHLYDSGAIYEKEKQKRIESLTQKKILTEDDWKEFRQLFSQVHPDFFKSLLLGDASITTADQRIAALIRLGLNQNEMADILGISKDSVRKGRYRLRQKLNLTEDKDLIEYIQLIN